MKVIMPQIGMTMVEGVIEKWVVPDGGHVEKGDIIVEISTEKLTNEIEAPASGIIQLIAEEGDIVECGCTIAEINSPTN